MSSRGRVVKRRGHPNRGGGRSNRPRGQGGGGKSGGSKGGGGKDAYYEYGDSYDDYDDFSVQSIRERDHGDKTSNRGSSSHRRARGGRGSSRGGHGTGREGHNFSEFRGDRSRGYRGSSGSRSRGPRSRVVMQRLHMSAENQDMVVDMLRELQQEAGPEGELGEEGEEEDEEDQDAERDYNELNWQAENQYWMEDRTLVVEDSDHYKKNTQEFSNLAVNKLMRYGFDKGRCIKALEETSGDIGKALEVLLCQCFDIGLTLNSEETDGNLDMKEENLTNNDVDWTDIEDQRCEEMTALSSMYDKAFRVLIPKKVWSIALDLPHLSAVAKASKGRDMGKSSDFFLKDKIDDREPCRFYLKGHCRFSRERCRYKHERPHEEVDRKHLDVEDSDVTGPDTLYELQIRFPAGNKYPLEAPLIAFSSTNPNLPQHVCLNICVRLMQEAKDLAESCLPIVYSLVSILEVEEELNKAFSDSPPVFSLPEPIITRRQVPVIKTLEPCAPPRTVTVPNDQPVSFDQLVQQVGRQRTSSAGERAYVGYTEEELDEVTATDKQEEYRKKYRRKDPESRAVAPREVEKVNRKIKDKFKKKKSSDGYQRLQADRQRLPAWSQQQDVLDTVLSNQVTVISGMTGCGKTTQVPQYILDSFLNHPGPGMCNIVCTQPRRLSAMAVADRVAQERDEKLGVTVGYQIRLESVMSSSTRLLFCTTGILLRRLEGDMQLNGVTHVIIDEVHERSEESDFLMMVLRDLLLERQDLKVILMSATLNSELFSGYFWDCPIVHIPGKTFPVEQFFLEDVIDMTNYIIDERSPFARPLKRANAVRQSQSKSATRDTVEEIDEQLDSVVNIEGTGPPKNSIHDQHLSPKQMLLRYKDYAMTTVKTMSIMDHEKINLELVEHLLEWIVEGQHEYPRGGAVLVFLPGMAEITSMYEQLQTNKIMGVRNKHKFKLIPLHSTLSSEDQQAVFRKPREGVTKIVLATNIAETSITIDDVVYVIDAGRMKEKRYDPSKGMESLDTVWVSRANALQRKGRAGRVAAGVCFHLFTSQRFQYHLREQPIPEIQRAPLEQLVLKIKMLDLFQGIPVQVVLSKIIEPPPDVSISTAMTRLQDLGALDGDQELTPLGYHLANLPVDVRIGKLMLFGAIFRCLDSALTIAATLSFKSPFVSPFDKRDDADKKKLEFAVGNSDHLTMLKAYRGWITAGKQGNYSAYIFCQDNFLSLKTLQMLASMKQQFVELLSDIGFVKEGLGSRGVARYGRDGSDGVREASGIEANSYSDNMKLVAAILVAALYPNVVQVLTPENKYTASGSGAIPKAPKPEELKFKTKEDGYISIHPSSVNFQVRYYESPYLVYHEKVKTTKVYVRDCTMVSVYPLLLFGGGSISVDLDKGDFVLSVDDGWIRFIAASHQVAELVRELRLELDQLLEDKIVNPSLDLLSCPRGSRIIPTIVRLITTQ